VSAAGRSRSRPGELGRRSWGEAKLVMMDELATTLEVPGQSPGQQRQLASRNPPLIQDFGEDLGRFGIREAWKRRL
jgi:hypothetical protein